MAYVATTLPLTGAGDPTAAVAVDNIGGALYQAMKIFSAEEGSTLAVIARTSAPASTDVGLVVRPITSTDSVMAVVGAVALTSEGSTRLVGRVDVNNQPTVDLSSVGSTRLAGRFTMENPTTAVTVDGAVTVSGTVAMSNPTTAVDLTSNGSTRLVGRVDVNNPTTAVSVSSGVVLGPSTAAIGLISSGTQTIGSVQLTSAGTTGSIGSVALLAGSSANMLGAITQGTPGGSSADAWWVRTVTTGSAGGSTTVDANLTSAGSTKIVGGAHSISGLLFDENGLQRTVSRAFANATTAGDKEVVGAQGAGVKIRVLSAVLVSSGGATVRFGSGSSAISGSFAISSNAGFVAGYNPHGYWQTDANAALNLNLASSASVGVDVSWIPTS